MYSCCCLGWRFHSTSKHVIHITPGMVDVKISTSGDQMAMKDWFTANEHTALANNDSLVDPKNTKRRHARPPNFGNHVHGSKLQLCSVHTVQCTCSSHSHTHCDTHQNIVDYIYCGDRASTISTCKQILWICANLGR